MHESKDDDFLIVSPHQFTLEPERPDMYGRDIVVDPECAVMLVFAGSHLGCERAALTRMGVQIAIRHVENSIAGCIQHLLT